MSIQEEIEKLEKEYIEYKEADMNREAGKVHAKLNRLKQKQELQELGTIKEIQDKYNKALKFIKSKGQQQEFENYLRKLGE